jgi:hypothetical protein
VRVGTKCTHKVLTKGAKVKSTALLHAPEPHLQPRARLYWRTSFTRGITRSAHSGHWMWSESTRYSFSGGIEYPHFGQRVLSDAFTLSRLSFCLLGIGAANYTWVRRSRLSTYMGCALTSTISTGELLAKRTHCWSAQGSRTRSTEGHFGGRF